MAATEDMPATVTGATALSTLMVLVDGAETPCPAESLDGKTYSVGDRVTARVRNPVRPLVLGLIDNEGV